MTVMRLATRASKTEAALVFLGVALLLALDVTSIAAAPSAGLAGRFEVSDMFEYRACSRYNEAPELAALVKAGKLPPIEQRLPEKPRVIKRAIMPDGIGVYGGVWRDTFAVPVQSWNWGAGHTQGWFGVNEMVQAGLVDLYPMWMMRSPEPAPMLATSWEWSEDGTTLTMHLMRGVKWSDGTPFTADDVVFTYENYILDPHIPSWVGAEAWTFGGKVTKLEKVDDYTIRWHFGVPYPIAAFYNMGYLNFSIVPKHVYAPFHPSFNPKATYDALLNATPPNDLPPVTLGAFIPVLYRPGEQLILVRNPYYWQVDEACNQLPYISEVWYTEATSGIHRTLNLLANKGDRDNVENPQMFSLIREAALARDSHFDLRFEGFTVGYELVFNLSRHLGVRDDRTRALRDLFRNVKFRQAVSHAIDREGIAVAASPGGLLTRPWYGGFVSGSPLYDEEVVTKYAYDPDRSRALLKEIGFKDTDGDGVVNWPDRSPLAGQNLVIELQVHEDQAASVEIAEALVPLFRSVGISLRPRVVKSTLGLERISTGEWEMAIRRLDTPAPDRSASNYGPTDLASPFWHKAGPGGLRELLDFERQLEKLYDQAKFTASADKRREIFREVLRIHTANLYTVGVYEARRGVAIHKRLKNIPSDLPVYLYEWGLENQPWTAWTPKELQIPPRFQELIPTREAYQNRGWTQAGR